MLDDTIRRALGRGQTIDITTTGWQSGAPRRKEIVFHNIDGRIIISGLPRPKKRDWLYNLEANPKAATSVSSSVVRSSAATMRTRRWRMAHSLGERLPPPGQSQ